MNNKEIKFLSSLSLIAACFAFLVIGLGAYTRLTDAGLGCPDWPGCYGHYAVPNSKQALDHARVNYPSQPLVRHKAWIEMLHRYSAGFLGLMIVAISITSVVVALGQGLKFLMIGIFLFALLIYQAVLGMWTVTLKLLPLVVSQHLLGGMAIFALLWLMYLNSRDQLFNSPYYFPAKKIKYGAFLGLLFVFFQISLGAWTSANYAALSCPDFPYCRANMVWHYNFHQAFDLLSPIGMSYQGGLLNNIARMTIQMMHRFGALTVVTYLLGFIGYIYLKYHHNKPLCKTAAFLLVIVLFEILLGISNIIFQLPLFIALAHNLCAALLLVTMVTLNYQVFSSPKKIKDLAAASET